MAPSAEPNHRILKTKRQPIVRRTALLTDSMPLTSLCSPSVCSRTTAD
jgi:hypothetical protein